MNERKFWQVEVEWTVEYIYPVVTDMKPCGRYHIYVEAQSDTRAKVKALKMAMRALERNYGKEPLVKIQAQTTACWLHSVRPRLI